MENYSDLSFNDLIEFHLGTRLPEEMAKPISITDEPQEARQFIGRLLLLMQESNYEANSFTPYLIRWLATIKTMLPSAWGGRIPPLTLPKRHKRLDTLIKNQDRFKNCQKPVFVDLGCGFPPVTTQDTAEELSGWQVYGVDQSFPDYILYNKEGHYGCFDSNGNFQYFQALTIPSGRELYRSPEKTRDYFINLFLSLKEGEDSTLSETSSLIEKEGCRLIRNHVLNFETDNLRFIESDLSEVHVSPVHVIRGMNVFIYFDQERRKTMLRQAGELLADGGLMVIGSNGLAMQSRYFVYEKNSAGLSVAEFGFSPDNLGHISFMPWFTIHENDPEATLLAQLIRAIRNDKVFWPEFSNELDKLQSEQGFCWRGEDGFFRTPDEEMTFNQYFPRVVDLWQQIDAQGYVDGAVEALTRADYQAWKNSIGDIAIIPPENTALV